jgi:hypothetical protein
VLEKGPEHACGETRFPCVLKHARDTGHVSTVPVYCVPVYCTGLLSYVSRRQGTETSLVRVRVRSTVRVYTLLYVGSGILSYVSRKLKVPRDQSVLYVEKSVRNP